MTAFRSSRAHNCRYSAVRFHPAVLPVEANMCLPEWGLYWRHQSVYINITRSPAAGLQQGNRIVLAAGSRRYRKCHVSKKGNRNGEIVSAAFIPDMALYAKSVPGYHFLTHLTAHLVCPPVLQVNKVRSHACFFPSSFSIISSTCVGSMVSIFVMRYS